MTDDTPCHLCVTHSTLVTRVFDAAMQKRQIPAGEIRTMSRRGAPFHGEGLRFDHLSDAMEKRFKKCDRQGFVEVWQDFDQTLRNLTGSRQFEAYVPHLNKVIYQEIVFHPDCVGFSFLEEGFTSMAWKGRLNSRTSWAKVLRSFVRSWRVGTRYRFTRQMFDHSPPHYRSAFAISRLAFRGIPGRTDVAAYLTNLKESSSPGMTYVILDAIYLFQGVHWEDYENALVEALGSIPLPTGEIYVKFHFADAGAPEKFESLRKRLDSADRPPLRLLGSDFPVEDDLTSCDLLLFAVTAMGYYAALSGVRVACFAEKIHGMSLNALIASGKLPEDFKRIVGLEQS